MALNELFFEIETDPNRDDVTALAVSSRDGFEYIARVYTIDGEFRGESKDQEKPYNNVFRPEDIRRLNYKAVQIRPSDPAYRIIHKKR